MDTILWQPTEEDRQSSQLHAFMRYLNHTYSLKITDYPALHHWSITQIGDFWQALADWSEVLFHEKPTVAYQPGKHMMEARWFQGATLNMAQHLLSQPHDKIACHTVTETGTTITHSYGDLYQQVASMSAFFRKQGLQKGDRVCAVVANSYHALVCMLATISLGAVWASSSPDYGADALIDRFQQIEPKFLITCDVYSYRGKQHTIQKNIEALLEAVPSITQTVITHHEEKPAWLLDNAVGYDEILSTYPDQLIGFESLTFDHPMWILFSSGTTGKPKCMVHRTGGMLLQHLKEHRLHGNLNDTDTLFFYTTCSWMMWHWMISGLLVGATIVLYDGSPFSPNKKRLFDIVDELGVTALGVGAKYLETCEQMNLKPKESHRLNSLRMMLTTGSPLLSKSFDYVYRDIHDSLQLCSISGGSDLVSCFALGNPILPVYRGELQCLGLGLDVDVFNEEGESVIGEEGELVCKQAFPCMPVYFWGDDDKSRYHAAYFERFPNVWTHGDYAKRTQSGGLIIQGRSDATLNPGGVRIGTAEIYQSLMSIEGVTDALAVGQLWDGSERIVLFLCVENNINANRSFFTMVKKHIRKTLSPKHVPAIILIAPDLPRTFNGKLMEGVVKNMLNEKPIRNLGALANPECLEFFSDAIFNLKEN